VADKKIKDFLKVLNAKLGIPEIDGWIAASDLNAVEISKEAATELEDSVKELLTPEAAKNNPGLKSYFKQNLTSSIKGEMLGNVDTQLHTITGNLFGDEARAEIEEIEFTKDKFRLFEEKLSDHQFKKADDKTKLQIEGMKNQLEKNQAAYKKKEDALIAEMTKLKSGMNEKLTHAEISRRIGSKQFAEKYNEEDMKSILMQTAISRINKEAIVKMNDKGELGTFDKDDPSMQYYIDGIEQTVDNLIDKHIGKYLAKSEPKRTKKEDKLPETKDKELKLAETKTSSLGRGIAQWGSQ
jgi:hypothetical protein